MFTEMPSWVPLAEIPEPIEERSLFDQGMDARSSSTPEGRLTSSNHTYACRHESGKSMLRSCKEVLQPKMEARSVMDTFKESASAKSLSHTPATALMKQTTVARMTQIQSVSGLKFTETVVFRALAQLPTLAKSLPSRPMDVMTARAPTSLPLPGQERANHHPLTQSAATYHQQTASFQELKEQKRHLEEQKSAPAQPLTKRHVEHFVFPLYIKIDDYDEQSRKGPRQTAKRISKIKKKRVSYTTTTQHHSYTYQPAKKRPVLEPPRMGIFALYYILTKIGIISDAVSHWEAKENIQKNQEELDKIHKLRLEEMKKAIESEEQSQRWGMSNQIFSWMGSFMAIISGIAMIMSGVGVIAGAMLLTSGIFMLANHLMMVTGAWDRICDKLPGDDKQKKKAVITWMQIGITVLCLILSGAAGIFGGFGAIGEAMQSFQAVFGGIMMFAGGISAIGQGVTSYQHRNRLAESLKHQRKLELIKHKQEDLFEKAHAGVDRLGQLFKDLSSVLDFESELFHADQMVIGR